MSILQAAAKQSLYQITHSSAEMIVSLCLDSQTLPACLPCVTLQHWQQGHTRQCCKYRVHEISAIQAPYLMFCAHLQDCK